MAVLLNLKSLIYRTKSGQSRLCHEGTGMGRSPVEGSVFFDGNLLHRISRSLEDEKEGGLLPRGWHEKAMHHQNRFLVEGFSGGGDPCNKGLEGGQWVKVNAGARTRRCTGGLPGGMMNVLSTGQEETGAAWRE